MTTPPCDFCNGLDRDCSRCDGYGFPLPPAGVVNDPAEFEPITATDAQGRRYTLKDGELCELTKSAT